MHKHGQWDASTTIGSATFHGSAGALFLQPHSDQRSGSDSSAVIAGINLCMIQGHRIGDAHVPRSKNSKGLSVSCQLDLTLQMTLIQRKCQKLPDQALCYL